MQKNRNFTQVQFRLFNVNQTNLYFLTWSISSFILLLVLLENLNSLQLIFCTLQNFYFPLIRDFWLIPGNLISLCCIAFHLYITEFIFSLIRDFWLIPGDLSANAVQISSVCYRIYIFSYKRLLVNTRRFLLMLYCSQQGLLHICVDRYLFYYKINHSPLLTIRSLLFVDYQSSVSRSKKQ